MKNIKSFEEYNINENIENENIENENIEKLKEDIDKMTHSELASLWRFGKSENKYLQGEAGEYLKDRLFNRFGGFNPSLSKNLGW